jgi:hypothetical protein
MQHDDYLNRRSLQATTAGGYDFLIPRFFLCPKFYRRAAEVLLLKTSTEILLVNTVTGRGLELDRMPLDVGQPEFEVEGDAVVQKIRPTEIWFGARLFKPLRVEGCLVILTGAADIPRQVRHVLRAAQDLEDVDSWDRGRAHANLAEEGVEEAVFVLRQGIEDPDPEVRKLSAWAIEDLWNHRWHDCYSVQGYWNLASLRYGLKGSVYDFDDKELPDTD